MSDTTSSFVVNLVINVVIGVVVLSAFIATRRRNSTQWLYNCRSNDTHRQTYLKAPPEYDTAGWFNWFRTTINTTETEMLESCGLDSVMYYIYYKAMIQFFGFFTILGVVILIPINVTSGNNASDSFSIMSMANITSNDNIRLTAHLLLAYLFFGTAIAQMTMLYDKFLKLRQIHLKTMQTLYCDTHTVTVTSESSTLLSSDIESGAESREFQYSNLSVLIRDLPLQYRTPVTFKEYFTYLFGSDNVQSSYLPKNVEYLKHLNNERDNLRNELEHTNIVYQQQCEQASKQNKTQPKPPTKFLFGKLKSVDKVQWLHNEIDRYTVLIQNESKRVQSDTEPYLSSGFVTLKHSVLHSLITYNTTVTHNTLQSTLSHAPEPDDVLFDQLNITHVSRIVRGYAVLAATIALVIFWSIPVTAISALTSLQNIGKTVPFLANAVNISPILSGFLSGFLPSLAFIIFQAMLPTVLLYFTKLEGKASKSELDLGLYQKFYLFQFINFFIITVLAGAVLNQIESFINSPTSIVTLFGESIPTVATQFLNYVIIQTFVSWPLSLLNIVGLIVGTLKQKYLAVTETEKNNALKGPTLSYGQQWPMDLLIYIIGVSYAVISPIILPFVLMYHVIGSVCIKYQSLYMYDKPEFETGGMYWPLAFNRMIASLVIAQITLLGLFGLKLAPVQAGFAAVLIPATILYAMQINDKWYPYAYSLSLHDAAEVDKIRTTAVNHHHTTSIYKQDELEPLHSDDTIDSQKKAKRLFDVHNTILFATNSVKKLGEHSKSVVSQLAKLTSPARFVDSTDRSNSEPINNTVKNGDIVLKITQ